MYRIIIGSSNLTLSALTKNCEWNTKIVSTEQGQVAKEILCEFNNLWSDEHTLRYEEFIKDYKAEYENNQIIKKQQNLALQEQVVDFYRYTLKPNKMQRIELWKKLLPANLPLEKDFDIEELAKYELTGGQIELVIKNTAYKIAVSDEPLFRVDNFKEQITKEQKGQFDSVTKVGFF